MKPKYALCIAITEEDREQLEYIINHIQISKVGIFRRGLLELMREIKEKEDS